jgi:DNA-binding transcriptional ArsR family regulator
MINMIVKHIPSRSTYAYVRSAATIAYVANHSESTLDATFAALADPTRRRILQRLAVGDTSVGEVVALFDVSAPAISRHLRVLEDSGLVSRQKEGRVHRLHIEREAMNEALGWIAHWGRFWESRFDALEELLLARDSEGR